jgi:hypothetical protein
MVFLSFYLCFFRSCWWTMIVFLSKFTFVLLVSMIIHYDGSSFFNFYFAFPRDEPWIPFLPLVCDVQNAQMDNGCVYGKKTHPQLLFTKDNSKECILQHNVAHNHCSNYYLMWKILNFPKKIQFNFKKNYAKFKNSIVVTSVFQFFSTIIPY